MTSFLTSLQHSESKKLFLFKNSQRRKLKKQFVTWFIKVTIREKISDLLQQRSSLRLVGLC